MPVFYTNALGWDLILTETLKGDQMLAILLNEKVISSVLTLILGIL